MLQQFQTVQLLFVNVNGQLNHELNEIRFNHDLEIQMGLLRFSGVMKSFELFSDLRFINSVWSY